MRLMRIRIQNENDFLPIVLAACYIYVVASSVSFVMNCTNIISINSICISCNDFFLFAETWMRCSKNDIMCNAQ